MAVLSPVVITGSRITSNYGNGTVIFRKKDSEGRGGGREESNHGILFQNILLPRRLSADGCNSVRGDGTRENRGGRETDYTYYFFYTRNCFENGSRGIDPEDRYTRRFDMFQFYAVIEKN